jgi:hypothetical protein
MNSISALLQALASLIRASYTPPAVGTIAHPAVFQLPLDPFFGPALYERRLGTPARIHSDI